MPLSIEAVDSQFAVSTGSNVNSGPNSSTFDYPPNSTMGLVLESQPGDDSPYIFSPGDTYTLSYGGQSGDTIENATVVRSDFISYNGDDGYAVVFEGLNSSGELVQVVWTPEFDLESWYWDNFDAGASPGFYTTDMDAATTYQAVCFEASMRIQTPMGPRPVGEIRPGDLVDTLDHGAQPVKWCAQRVVHGWGKHAPVTFQKGALGNARELVLSQQHRILLDLPEEVGGYGHAQLLLPALSFVDGVTVRVRPREQITYVHLLLDHHALISCEGVVCESLYLGHVAQEVLADGGQAEVSRGGLLETVIDMVVGEERQVPARPFVGVREGHRILSRVMKRPARKTPMLLPPGRKQARTYQLDPAQGLNTPGRVGLPAFVSLYQTVGHSVPSRGEVRPH